MKYFLKLYPPLKFKDGTRSRRVRADREEVKVCPVLEEVLREINSNETGYRPGDLLVIIDDRVAGRESTVKDGQVVKIMLMAMGG